MGEQKVSLFRDKIQMQKFVRNLLQDVHSLEYMLDNDWFEDDITRIGAEQEMCLVDTTSFKPASVAMEVIERMNEVEWLETELAQFNLEITLNPHEFTGDCLMQMEEEIRGKLNSIRDNMKGTNANILLTGILPTLRKYDLEMHNITPKRRYKALMEAINEQLLGSTYELRLKGIDELLVKHDSPMLEACNTSFQVHLQVAPSEFVKMYNISQVLAAPSIAIAANSPIVFGKRLWHETRIAIFQQALDTRSTHYHLRERSPRVSFGRGWLENSILDIYREDIARFRVLLAGDVEEDSISMIREGKVPKLRALQIHNSTVYRWNRPCYGISPNGKPHLRIENRVLPSGPTVVDEVANAAFWLGCMVGIADEVTDIRDHIGWDDIRDNFVKSARYGIDSNFTWFDNEKVTATDLIIEKLVPIARKGLQSKGVRQEDIERYMSIISGRAKKHCTGARWALRAYTKLSQETTSDEALSVLTAAILNNQQDNMPVHDWDLPELADLENYRPQGLKVEEFMTTDLFTVQPNDIIDLVAEMMDWRRVRHAPVEDGKGHLVGLVSIRILLRHFIHDEKLKDHDNKLVADIMIKDPVTIHPEANIVEAMHLMRDNKISCLPVVQNNELIGIITEMDFLSISSRLIERLKSEKQG